MSAYARARREGVITEEVGDELMVYVEATKTALEGIAWSYLKTQIAAAPSSATRARTQGLRVDVPVKTWASVPRAACPERACDHHVPPENAFCVPDAGSSAHRDQAAL